MTTMSATTSRRTVLRHAIPWDAAPSPTGRIGRQELRLLAIMASGVPLHSIARRIGVSDRTVRRRIRRVCDALDVHTPIEAVAWAARRRLI